MTRHNILFRLPQAVKAAVGGAALLILGMQAAPADSTDGMTNMEGMQHGNAPAAMFSFGAPGQPADVDRTVSIIMTDMSFEPASLVVTAGETIRFVVTNKSEVDHDFTIGDVEAQIAHRAEMADAMEQGGEMAHTADPNAMSVKAGEMRELIWTFTSAGSLEFDCNVPGHYEAGMKGGIDVQDKGAVPVTLRQQSFM